MMVRKDVKKWMVFGVVLFWLIVPLTLFAGGKSEGGEATVGFDKSCAVCHSSTPQYPILGAKLGYEHSGHNLGYELQLQNSYYANGGGCQKCHTNEGFIQFVTTGEVNADGFIAYPSQPGCFTCHAPHETGDMSVRTVAPVTLVNGTTFDKGEGNLCANCHQARSDAKSVVISMPADKLRSYWGPHHGPEADVLAGTNAYEFPGKSYASSAHTSVIGDACVTCHMSLPEGRYSLSPEVGGHSFNMVGEVHEAEKVNLSACTSCHKDMKQAKGSDYFDKKAADYDQDGTVEPVQAEVKGLLERFVNTNGSGVLQTLSLPMYKKDGSWNQVAAGNGDRSVEEIAALFNYKLILEDRSLGIHNTKYTIQVLYDTLAALDPTFDTSKRP